MRTRWRPGTAWVIALAAVWAAVRVVTGFDGLSGQDPHEYLRYAGQLHEVMLGGGHPGPFFWPVLYPMLGALLSLSGLPVAVALQLLSAGAWLAAFALGGRLAIREGDREALCTTYWVASFAMAPYVFRASLMVMSDALALAAVFGCLAAAASWHRTRRTPLLICSFLCAGVAAATRYPTVVSVAPAIFWLAAMAIRQRKFGGLAAGIGAAALPALPHLVLRWPRPSAFLGHDYLADWGLGHAFSRSFDSANGTFEVLLPNSVAAILAPVHPGFFLPGLALLAFVRAREVPIGARLALAGAIAQTLFIVGVPDQNPRFFLLSAPLALVALAPALQRAADQLGPRLVGIGLVLCLFGQAGLAARALQGPVRLARLEQAVVVALDRHPPTTLYTFWLAPALSSRGVEHRVVDLWTEEMPPPASGDLVLFAPERFESRWGRHRVMARFRSIERSWTLEPIERFDGGWTLWMIPSNQEGGP